MQEFDTMTAGKDHQLKEVSIIKKRVTIDSEDYVSVSLKSNEDSIDTLIQKAISAASDPQYKLKKTTLDAIK
jgi:hypothetical protein